MTCFIRSFLCVHKVNITMLNFKTYNRNITYKNIFGSNVYIDKIQTEMGFVLLFYIKKTILSTLSIHLCSYVFTILNCV